MISLFGWEKGGVGKTNTAVQMVAMLAMAGKDVILVDGDKQGSASNWAAIRNQNENVPFKVPCSARLGRSCGTDPLLYSQKYEHVVIDAGGRDSAELRYAMAVADVVVMPVRPGQYDAWAVNSMVSLKKEVEDRIGREVRIVAFINACSTATNEASEAREFLTANYSDVFEILDTVIYDRVAHRRSSRDGQSVVELTRDYADAKAVKEMCSLFEEIYGEKWEQK